MEAEAFADSTLTAGGNVNLIATGNGAKDADGFAAHGNIDARGTHISGKNVTLDAARDINLQNAKDTTQLSSSNSSSGGSIGIGAGLGGQQNARGPGTLLRNSVAPPMPKKVGKAS